MTIDPYIRKCEAIRVVDGDTIDLRIDLGYRATTEQRIRLLDIDTPELRSERADERAAAQEAKQFVTAWLDQAAGQLTIRSEKGDSFGRWLGELHREGEVKSLNSALVAEGLATTWPYRWRDVHPAPEVNQ